MKYTPKWSGPCIINGVRMDFVADKEECDMLRAFYIAWVDMHKIPRDPLHRRKMEVAAQLLVDRAHDLKEFYKSQLPERLHG